MHIESSTVKKGAHSITIGTLQNFMSFMVQPGALFFDLIVKSCSPLWMQVFQDYLERESFVSRRGFMKKQSLLLVVTILILAFFHTHSLFPQEGSVEESKYAKANQEDEEQKRDEEDYTKWMLGVSISYGRYFIGRDVRSSNAKSISGNEKTVDYENWSPSVVIKTTPRALLPHFFSSASLDLYLNEKIVDDVLFQTNVLGAHYGFYLNSGDLYKGDVGLFGGIYAGVQGAQIQGSFRSDVSFRDDYLKMVALTGGNGLPDYLDSYVFYQGIHGTLDQTERNLYLGYRGGWIPRELYIQAVLLKANLAPLEYLSLLNMDSTALDLYYSYHLTSKQSDRRKGTYGGYMGGAQIGYYGDFFMIVYDVSIGSLQDARDVFSVENHKLTAGLFIKF